MSATTSNAHEFFMRKCIDLAIEAKTNGESPVGSIIVRNDTIIATGIEAGKANMDITFHAEIEAIRMARKVLNTADLSDCIIYTTHEPCIMCSYVIRQAKIGMVVMSLSSGDTGGFNSQLPVLKDTSITKWGTPPIVITGILEAACREL
ncbi:MAG TPA: nucleoside deaminase [Flavipsychrobacter sp.]|nr:nucleoside deaminase [Flavipsychrobacter sp.]